MSTQANLFSRIPALAWACLLGFAAPWVAMAQPAQTPLLVTSTGAKPNVMMTIDNSGSMNYPAVTMANSTNFVTACTGRDRWGTSFNGPNLYIDSTAGQSIFYLCVSTYAYDTGTVPTYANRKYRSPDYWDLYYDPREIYEQRVSSTNTKIAPSQSRVTNTANKAVTINGITATTGAPINVPSNIGGYFESYLCTNTSCSNAVLYRLIAGSVPQKITYTDNTASSSTAYDKFANRTDCAGTRCTEAEEWKNIANWYEFYSTRMKSSATAIGSAMNNTDFNNKLRLGYSLINANGSPGTAISRSVKLFGSDTTADATNKANFYSFLYSISPNGGTPLHSAIDVVANYYKTQSPWLKDPDSTYNVTTNPELYCKRSFNILFSDGAWNGSSTVNSDFDNTAASTAFTRYTPANTTAVTPTTLAYSPTGNTDRGLYTPFGSASTRGLADLTAGYYWREDFRNTNNGVATKKRTLASDLEPRSPTFWQNMTTYTIGYGIRPSGELPTDNADYNANGLTFAKIQKYQTDYFTLGTGATRPPWPSINLNSSGSEQDKVDDFIQAGFTGGGFGASVNTPAEVSAVFSKIVNGILEAIGNDAGVAASAGAGAFEDYSGTLKYETKYSTKNNTGDIEAYALDANGDKVDASNPTWKASSKMPAFNLRNIYAMSGTNSPFAFSGNLSSMSADVQLALKPASATNIPSDSRYINYLRGSDAVLDNDGLAFRVREDKLAASVNSPPRYVGDNIDNAYDLTGTVSGSASYLAYFTKKQSYPASIMEATNAGMVHVLSADTGDEWAAFMPRGAMSKLTSSYSKTAYDFQYILDGVLAEQDIYNTTLATPAWNSVVVGTGGRGGKFAFALRSPLKTTSGATNRKPDVTDFLWEIGENDVRATNSTLGGVNMGFMTQNAKMGQTYNGEWVTILNNGHYSNGTSGLIVVNAMTGAHIRSIPLPSGTSNDPGRGLSGATLIHDSNKRIVGAYAGDDKGHMWRFSLLGTPSQWEVSYGRPLFTDPEGKPIYGAPTWQNHPKGGTIVVFGTGMLMDDTDLADTTTKSLFGIWDPMLVDSKLNTSKLADLEKPAYTLLQQTVSATADITQAVTGVPLYAVSKNTIDWTKHKGWQLKLGQITDNPTTGERVIGEAANLGSSVIISTVVRSNSAASDAEVCEAVAGNPPNFTYIVDALSGGNKKSYDANADGKADDYSVGYFATGGFARNNTLKIKAVDYYATQMVDTDAGKALRIKFSTENNESVPPVSTPIPTTATCQTNFGAGCDVEPTTYTATPCGAEGENLGLSGASNVYDGCDVAKSWKRSWRQVINPPK